MDTEIRVSTESRPWRRKFSHCSCRDSNPRPFSHESGALTTELSPPPVTTVLGYVWCLLTGCCDQRGLGYVWCLLTGYCDQSLRICLVSFDRLLWSKGHDKLLWPEGLEICLVSWQIVTIKGSSDVFVLTSCCDQRDLKYVWCLLTDCYDPRVFRCVCLLTSCYDQRVFFDRLFGVFWQIVITKGFWDVIGVSWPIIMIKGSLWPKGLKIYLASFDRLLWPKGLKICLVSWQIIMTKGT